ncbi:hypothetical protein AMK24_01480 [Streptomyces sp. CB02366]|nr:hypothetical protein AMK24_01480 [Streptomyces sp. CB02366]
MTGWPPPGPRPLAELRRKAAIGPVFGAPARPRPAALLAVVRRGVAVERGGVDEVAGGPRPRIRGSFRRWRAPSRPCSRRPGWGWPEPDSP